MWRKAGAALFALGVMAGVPANAGVYTDDLTKCLLKSASSEDQIVFVQWVFSALALHPAVQQYSKFTPAQQADLTKKAAALFTRLMTVDCRKETGSAVKYEGAAAIETSFKTLGEVASRNLFSDPHVAKGLEGLSAGFDEAELKKVIEEANSRSQ